MATMRPHTAPSLAHRGWRILALLLLALLGACSDSDPRAPRISVQPADTAAVVGSAATLTVDASGSDIAYQWQQSSDGGSTWTDLAGATSATYTTAPLVDADNGRRYRVVVTAAGIRLASSAATLTVTAAVVAPVITVAPPSLNVTAPAHAVFSVTASGTALGYQWQRSDDGGASWNDIAGATDASFDAGATDPAMSGARYRVVVANSAGSVTSAAATLSVDPAPAVPAFTAQPASQAVAAGSAAAFSVAVTGAPAPTLQWQRSTDGGASWVDLAGETGALLNIGTTTLAQDGERYRVVASNASGSVASSEVVLTVSPAAAAPAITAQPGPQTVTAPAGATFVAAASGVPTPSWQWQLSSDGGSTFANINGATSASYTTPPTVTGDSGRQYRAVASNASGSATTAAVALTVNAPAVASAYEGFDYPLGDRLKGKNGGIGWSGAWDITDGAGTPLDIAQSGQVGSGLSYTDGAGNTLVTSGGAWQTEAAVFFAQARRPSTGVMGAAGSAGWMSFLVKQGSTTAGVNYAMATPGAGYTFGSPAMATGVGGGGSAVANCFYCNTVPVGGSTPIDPAGPGSVHFFLVRIDFAANGNDTMNVWIDPPLDAGTPLGAPTMSIALADYASTIDGITLAWGDNRTFSFDELRLGTSRAAVAPYQAPAASGSAVFATDFTAGMPAQLNPSAATIVGTEGFASLGPVGGPTFGTQMLRVATGDSVTLTLTNLPPHQWLTLEFLLAAIDSLDGAGTYPAGDYARVTVDGVDIFREAFANASIGQIQTYAPPPGVQLARMVDLGFTGPGSFYTDSAYWMGGDPVFQRIPHTASTVVITFQFESSALQGLADESWGIGQLRVQVGP